MTCHSTWPTESQITMYCDRSHSTWGISHSTWGSDYVRKYFDVKKRAIICAIYAVFMRNSYLLTILEIIDAKFAHLP